MLDARAHRLLVELQSFSFDEPGAARPFSARLHNPRTPASANAHDSRDERRADHKR